MSSHQKAHLEKVVWNMCQAPVQWPKRGSAESVTIQPGYGYNFETDEIVRRPAVHSNEYRVTDPVTGGQKNQKPEQMSLLPVEALKAVSRVYAFGAEKYSRDNWRLGYDWHLSYDAMQRHLMAFWGGEDTDPDSGESHLAHAVFHALTLITYQQRGLGNDDRK